MVRRKIEQRDGDLQEIDEYNIVLQMRREQGRAQTEADLVALGRSRGMKRPELWARHVLRARLERDNKVKEFELLRQKRLGPIHEPGKWLARLKEHEASMKNQTTPP